MGQFSKWQTDYLYYFSLTFYANYLLRRHFSWNDKHIFWGKYEKYFKVSSAEIFTRHAVLYYCNWKIITGPKAKTWMLTLNAPVTTAADNNFLFFIFFFQRKQVWTFHVNHLLSRWFTWNIKTCFLWKIKKNNFNVVCYKFCYAL